MSPYLLNDCICPFFAKAMKDTAIPQRLKGLDLPHFAQAPRGAVCLSQTWLRPMLPCLLILVVLGMAVVIASTLGEATSKRIHVTAQVAQQTFLGDPASP